MKVGQDASPAGSTTNNDPTRHLELEAGISTEGNSTGHSRNNLGSKVALFAGIISGCVIFIVIIITLVVLLLKYRRRHGKHSPQHLQARWQQLWLGTQ
ncbi:ephrin-B2-like isoform X2 [Cricetulus griseus]|uniref:Ephrin-B2-like isoform X2 n=1 Tax=Cricetulus griseus TaxID=10029 RepID=A0A9J7HDJ8_CRIGR|nr:ephrin-B2-like isoform X2 [Cricetulus griseus]